MAVVFLALWALTAHDQRRDLAAQFTGAGGTVVLCQVVNQVFFNLAIAAAPVAMVLFGIAVVPVFSAVFA